MSRKEREVEQRESCILQVAREIVVREGYHSLSMDRIAEAIEYSKGTIYNHFPCKEEIIVALGQETMQRRIDLFGRASLFAGRPRERMMAVGVAAELFARQYPDHFVIDHMIRMSSIWDKVTEKRRMAFQTSEHRCISTVSGIVRDAVACGDLELAPGFSPEDLVFGLWSLTFGAYSLIFSNPQLRELGISDPILTVRTLTQRLVDGFNWRPLSSELDYDAVSRRVAEEIFSQECAALPMFQ